MAGYTYTSYVNTLQAMAVSQAPDVPFDTILPSIIAYAENRIYRELNLLATNVSDTSVTLVAGQREADIPDAFVVINNLNVYSPAGSTTSTGERVPLVPVSRDVVDTLWPNAGTSYRGTPAMYAMQDQWTIILGPAPDGAYLLETVGTQRPAPLSATNATTFLSSRLPDLFMAASMVFVSGYQRNFANMGNDPQMGTSWEAQYQLLFKSADTEEARKAFRASSWSSQQISPQAQPQRG